MSQLFICNFLLVLFVCYKLWKTYYSYITFCSYCFHWPYFILLMLIKNQKFQFQRKLDELAPKRLKPNHKINDLLWLIWSILYLCNYFHSFFFSTYEPHPDSWLYLNSDFPEKKSYLSKLLNLFLSRMRHCW